MDRASSGSAWAPLCGQENGDLMQPKPVHRKMLTLSMVPLEKSSFLLGFLKDHSSFHYTENVLFGRAGAVAAPALPAWLLAQRGGKQWCSPWPLLAAEDSISTGATSSLRITQAGGKTPLLQEWDSYDFRI